MDLVAIMNKLMGSYHEYYDQKTSASKTPFFSMRSEVEEDLKSKLSKRGVEISNYTIKFSIGEGRLAAVPWIAVMKNAVTLSIKKGIYVAYLFSQDSETVYLSITQGVSEFEYENNKREEIRANAARVRSFISPDIIRENDYVDKIELSCESKKTVLSEQYEDANIIAKEYKKNSLPTIEVLIDDLIKMLDHYDDLMKKIDDFGYQVKGDKSKTAKNKIPKLQWTQELELPLNPENKNKKVDDLERGRTKYIYDPKKNERDILLGNQGEEAVLEYERNRLNEEGQKKLAQKVKWIAAEDSAAGYDVLSYRRDAITHEYKEIYIEVKTTTNSSKPFFISKNELEMWKKREGSYYIYRVILDNKPRVMSIVDLDKIEFEPYSYICYSKAVTNQKEK